MKKEQTEKNREKFFTLDVKNKRDRKKFFKSKSLNCQGESYENEWIQEYELIYLSHRRENWHLEEANSK